MSKTDELAELIDALVEVKGKANGCGLTSVAAKLHEIQKDVEVHLGSTLGDDFMRDRSAKRATS